MARQKREFTAQMVQSFMQQPRLRECLINPHLQPNEWTMDDLAKELGMNVKMLQTWALKRWVHIVQRPFAGTWVIWANDNELQRLKALRSRPNQNQPPPAELRTPTDRQ